MQVSWILSHWGTHHWAARSLGDGIERPLWFQELLKPRMRQCSLNRRVIRSCISQLPSPQPLLWLSHHSQSFGESVHSICTQVVSRKWSSIPYLRLFYIPDGCDCAAEADVRNVRHALCTKTQHISLDPTPSRPPAHMMEPRLDCPSCKSVNPQLDFRLL